MSRMFLLPVFLSAALIVPLAACGGGGGGNDVATPSQPQGPQIPVSPPEPPAPSPLLSQLNFGVSYPREGTVTFEEEIGVRGSWSVPDSSANPDISGFSMVLESDGQSTVVSLEQPGAWSAEAVPLAAGDSPAITVFVRGPNGGETQRQRIALSRNNDDKDAILLAAGFNPGEFLALFAGNEVRTYDSAGTELGRRPLPTYQSEFQAELAVWPHTGEVIQAVETSAQECSLVAHRFSQSEPLESRVLTTIEKPLGSRSACYNLVSVVARAETLFVINQVSDLLVGLDSSGNQTSAVSLPEELPYRLVSDPNSSDLIALRLLPGAPDADAPSAGLDVLRLDPITGAQTLVSQTPVRTSGSSFFGSAVLLGNGLFYHWGGVFYRIDLDTGSEAVFSYTGFTAVSPRDPVAAGLEGAGCPNCFYVLDSTGRVARVDTTQATSAFVTDTSPGITPIVGFSDIQFESGERVLWENHSEIFISPSCCSDAGWRNLYAWEAGSLAVQPLQQAPDFESAGPQGQLVAPRLLLISRSREEGGTEIAFYNTETQAERLFDIDYTDLGNFISARYVGLRGEYLTIQSQDSVFDYSLEPAVRLREWVADVESMEPRELFTVLARFPGADGTVYARSFDRSKALFRVDFDAGALEEVSGPSVGDGPAFSDGINSVQHWSLETNEAFMVNSGVWWRIDLGTGDRTVLFDGGAPEGLADDFFPSDMYYVSESNTLLASSAAGLFEISLDTGTATLRSVLW